MKDEKTNTPFLDAKIAYPDMDYETFDGEVGNQFVYLNMERRRFAYSPRYDQFLMDQPLEFGGCKESNKGMKTSES